jgi:hypothetical protein
MKAKSIVLDAAVLRSLLDGKTNIVKSAKGLEMFNEQPQEWVWDCTLTREANPCVGRHAFFKAVGEEQPSDMSFGAVCPYGVEGSMLWVRETWTVDTTGNGKYLYKTDRDEWSDVKWRPSTSMPQSASRILLGIRSIHVGKAEVNNAEKWVWVIEVDLI